MCTPTSLAFSRGRGDNSGERGEDGGKDAGTEREGWRRREASAVPTVAPGRRAMNYRNEISQQMPSFRKEWREWLNPLENTVIREGEPGVCQTLKGCVCVCVCCRVALG